MNTVWLLGAGGHAKVVLDCMQMSLKSLKILDDDESRHGMDMLGTPISASIAALPKGVDCHLAIGHNATRYKLLGQILQNNCKCLTVIHPMSYCSPRSDINDGCFIAAGAVVSTNAQIAEACIINHSAIVDHDCKIDTSSHIAPGAVLGGNVSIGKRVLIGANATVLPGVTIGDDVIIGAGSVVTKNIPPASIAYGVPAKEQ